MNKMRLSLYTFWIGLLLFLSVIISLLNIPLGYKLVLWISNLLILLGLGGFIKIFAKIFDPKPTIKKGRPKIKKSEK